MTEGPYAKPAATAARLLEIASMVETNDGRVFVERVNAVFLNEGGDGYAYRAGVALLKRDGLIDMHDSGTFFRFTGEGARRFVQRTGTLTLPAVDQTHDGRLRKAGFARGTSCSI